MLNTKSIKDHLLSNIPKYGVKMHESPFNACTFNEVKITCINKLSVFGQKNLENSFLNIFDCNYNRKYLLSNLIQQEYFVLLNFSNNFYAFNDEKIKRSPQTHYFKNLNPHKYYMLDGKSEKIQEIAKESKISKIIYEK